MLTFVRPGTPLLDWEGKLVGFMVVQDGCKYMAAMITLPLARFNVPYIMDTHHVTPTVRMQ